MKLSVQASLAFWTRRLDYRRKKAASVRKKAHSKHSSRGTMVTEPEAIHIKKWDHLVAEAEKAVNHRRDQIAASRPLRLRALHEMGKLVGIMEVGGNNMGAGVLRIIRANGGTGPEAWCGDTVAYAYRAAGSKVVQRGWAAVRLLGFLTGMKVVSYADALPGDIVCYKFDHTGMLNSKISSHEIETIEGNTGASGAVSDSATGGDGVYIKRRDLSLVARFVRVTR